MIPTRTLSITQLYTDHLEKLKLTWIAAVGVERQVVLKDQGIYGPDVVGHLNLIYSHRVQVIGKAEQRWAERVGEERWQRQIDDLMAATPPALIVADGLKIPSGAKEMCEATQTPLFVTPKECSVVIDLLHIYLARRFADTVSAHGVFMDVYGMGILITGDSGVGKSELALELVTRGHGLVADDVVELARTAPTTIEGRCPSMLRDYLEVRGLGLLNIRTIFGETAARRKMKLKLVVHLQEFAAGEDSPRLPLDSQTQEILGIPVRKVVFHVAPGRNLAVLLEAAVRNCILQMRGIDSMSEFINRQQQAVLDDDF
ncbi:HPr kinase/phosphorylase [Candidatus Propionivibrio aalborgensis]|jgi:HPr kinase/phosphorylase|uniref:HPr kinase/phosphorylase n=1 Tax=Candidatus Propionivibrio aalborgensis TaxID=1860101 RepID=A0A1A8XS78_9RHOO|nr:HPr(Ser) kinase/phosphatase [Candidatus Propionivibrio aalborgensis]MBK7325446.1 HPr kinase/phosphorylase [Propionivibrio sp.]MBK7565295.1 HPr kinase/phosphorylase [Propionivibrio sp.]MBK9027281.1 HPr kinase/phosphorylase [Propionivibrio sp.]SBT07556.1 HPr kinase/phosphorylase [Candidatus Propionivibrio aalborgensis]HRC59873.1 HPr(Ser) kinase/phosphatase [Candidatus Propionivibrio aalborgensis]